MNILHIMCDQFRYDCISALGNREVKTPNIDRLVHNGVSFTNAYTPSPVCVAARCSMIFGQYPTKTKCYANDTMCEGKTFMDELSDIGYTTHAVGKCHFTPDSLAMRGFDERERQEEGDIREPKLEPYYSFVKAQGYSHVLEPNGIRGEMYYIPQTSPLPQAVHPSCWVGNRTVDFIEKNTDKKWYLFSSFIHPHPPFAPPTPYNKMYRVKDLSLPKNIDDASEHLMFVNLVQNRYKYKDNDNGFDYNLALLIKSYYYACITFIDVQIGKILDALEKTGQMDNTMIVFTSDHGELLGDYGSYGKRSMQDSSAKIPMVIYCKGKFEGGIKFNEPVSLVDLAPTFTGKVNNYDGVNLLSLLRGEIKRDCVFSFYSSYQDAKYAGCELPSINARENMTNMMIKTKEYKYIYSFPEAKEFLYKENIVKNRASDSDFSSIKAILKRKLLKYLEDNGENGYIRRGDFKKFNFIAKLPADKRMGLLIQDTEIKWFNN